MIKLTNIEPLDGAKLALTFSDGSHGTWPAESLLAADTVLTRALREPAYFARAFIEAGALAWPNGLELSAWTLRDDLREAGALEQAQAA